MARKVLYILPPTKTFAGIERVVDEVCHHMAATFPHRFAIDVLFTARYPGHGIENRRYRTIQREATSRTELIRVLREVAGSEVYDLVVIPQVEATVITWFACLGRRKPFIVYLHGNPKVEARSWKARILFFLMRTIVLNRLVGVFGVAKSQLEAFRTQFPSRIPHFWVPNPVRRFPCSAAPILPAGPRTADAAASQDAGQDSWRDAGRSADEPVTYVNVGRFSYQKGQDILLRAFAKAYRARRNVRLVLVGHGPDRGDLVAQIEALGLADVARIAHHPDNPQAPLAASDVYVSASRWEGWSLAICEALRMGLPVIATDCEFGPRDILVDRRLGLLVPPDDEEGIAAAMIAFHDNLARERAHRAFRMDYIDAFSVETVAHDHASALEAACASPLPSRAGRRASAWTS